MRMRINNHVNRYFKMLDSEQSLKDNARVVVNIRTCTNIAQAEAEGISRANAEREHSDYIEWVWIRHFNPGFTCKIHMESGRVHLNNRWFDMPNKPARVQNHEYSHNWQPEHIRHHCGVQIKQQRVIISNPESNPERFKHTINSCFNVVKLSIGPVHITTCSRKCDLHVGYGEDHTKCTGALIKQSDDNQIDHLEHVQE